MEDKFMLPEKQFPNRKAAWEWEYNENQINRGPWNKIIINIMERIKIISSVCFFKVGFNPELEKDDFTEVSRVF